MAINCATCFFGVPDSVGLSCRVSAPISNARIYVTPDYWCSLYSAIAPPSFVTQTFLNIIAFGGDPSGNGDTSPALNAALASLPAQGGLVYFPPGKYKFLTTVLFALAGPTAAISIVGSGMNATELYWPNPINGLTFYYSNPNHTVHVRDLAMTTGQFGLSTALSFNQSVGLGTFAISTIERVLFRGADANAISGIGEGYFWSVAYHFKNVSGTTVDSVAVWGPGNVGVNSIGGLYEGAGTTERDYSIYHNISKSIFNGLTFGIMYGSYCQGMTITQTNFQNGQFGFCVPVNALGTLLQLQISDSQFATTGNAIQVLSDVGDVMIHHNDIAIQSGMAGILINTGNPNLCGSIIGNVVHAATTTGTSGIAMNGNGYAISGNSITGAAIGVSLLSAAANCNVFGNIYLNCASNTANAGQGNGIGTITA